MSGVFQPYVTNLHVCIVLFHLNNLNCSQGLTLQNVIKRRSPPFAILQWKSRKSG